MSSLVTNCLALSFTALLLPGLLAAQPAPDSIPAPAFAKAVSLYHQNVGEDAAIYNGRAYQPHDGVLLGGDPYFQSSLAVKGTVTYDSLEYDGIPLLYDLVRDQLVITDPKGQLLSVYNDKVQQFTLGRHHFVRLTIEGAPDYYELLTPGRVSFVARRSKTIDEKIDNAILQHNITPHDFWFLNIDGQYHPFSSEKGLLRLLEDKKKAIRQYMHTQDIRFSRDPEKAAEQIIDFYNQQPR